MDAEASTGGPGNPFDAASDLPHLSAAGRARMVDVGDKQHTARTAVARAQLHVTPSTARRIADGALPKGDALAVARLAAIQAAKRTWELIPLCHQVALSSVDVDARVDVEAGVVTIEATARTVGQTGVEMEALVACGVGALALYDLVKAVERGATVRELGLVRKTGGVRGDWERRGEDRDGPASDGT